MATEIKVPTLGESVTEATVAQWFKKTGEQISADEPVVELETEKVTIEVPAPASGILSEIVVLEGENVEVGHVLGAIAEVTTRPADGSGIPEQQRSTITKSPLPKTNTSGTSVNTSAPQEPVLSPPPLSSPVPNHQILDHQANSIQAETTENAALKPSTPLVTQLISPQPAAKQKPKASPKQETQSALTNKTGHIQVVDASSTAQNSLPDLARDNDNLSRISTAAIPKMPTEGHRERRVKMSRLRQTIARRLLEVQQSAALLTTFNEVDMSRVIKLRTDYKDVFKEKHNVKLGFMSFFVKAVVQSLKEIPAINAQIEGDEIVYKDYFHIGVAVGTDKGLVVPVLRDADQMKFAEIEQGIRDMADKARAGKLAISDLQAGTFTITNGGIYGSMLSTPIINAPQSGILGMHSIEERPVARNGEVVIRPMMYLALTYDHRIVDGKEAVSFLVRIRENLEKPERLMLDL